VTYRCNERCEHCYLDHEDHGEMTTAEIKGILDQLAASEPFFLRSAEAKFFCAAIFLSCRLCAQTAFQRKSKKRMP